MKKFPAAVAAMLALLSLFFSCTEQSGDILARNELFSLSVGKMEDQLDLFQVEGIPFTQKTRLTMKDGIFSISNGNSYKIMQFNSYGDLLSLYYNPEENPKPVLLRSEEAEGTVVNKRAYPYPFRQVGEIAVSGQKVLYVEERLPESRRIFAEDMDAVLERVVVRFSRSGEMLDYIGQEGVGGTPFPYIEAVNVTDSDELVVSCRTGNAWIVFWYSPAGDLLYRIDIPLEGLPVPEESAIPFLESMYPSPDGRIMYVKINFYREAIDPATGKKFQVENLNSRVYILNVETGRYESWVEVPINIRKEDSFGMIESQSIEYTYQFMGAARDGFLFFLSPKEVNSYELLVLARDGRTVASRNIVIEDEELIFKTFDLSPEGILSALLCRNYEADVVWWRTDELIRNTTR